MTNEAEMMPNEILRNAIDALETCEADPAHWYLKDPRLEPRVSRLKEDMRKLIKICEAAFAAPRDDGQQGK